LSFKIYVKYLLEAIKRATMRKIILVSMLALIAVLAISCGAGVTQVPTSPTFTQTYDSTVPALTPTPATSPSASYTTVPATTPARVVKVYGTPG
jgi:hypothetical protein